MSEMPKAGVTPVVDKNDDRVKHRIGIYGGGFDPVHCTHLSLAKTVTTYLGLNRLIWVPTGVAWHKKNTLSQPHDRVQMLERAFQDIEGEVREKWRISTYEIEHPSNSYTIDTLRFLQNENQIANTQWYVVMGADQFAVLQTWKDWPELLERCTLAVVGRGGVELTSDVAVLEQAQWVNVPFELSAMSSSQVRDLAKRMHQGDLDAHKQLAQLVPEAVVGYIAQHQLYK